MKLLQSRYHSSFEMNQTGLGRLADEHARALRQELADNLRGFQETTLKVFREFG